MTVNSKLPASIYIPFSKAPVRLCSVLNIVVSESKVFATKERNPFYICLETFCPCEQLPEEEQESFWEKVQNPITLKGNFKSENNFRKSGRNKFSLASFNQAFQNKDFSYADPQPTKT